MSVRLDILIWSSHHRSHTHLLFNLFFERRSQSEALFYFSLRLPLCMYVYVKADSLNHLVVQTGITKKRQLGLNLKEVDLSSAETEMMPSFNFGRF